MTIYNQLFQCPPNYSLDTVICTTMSIDAIAAVNLIAVATHPEYDPLSMTQEQLTMLMNGNLRKKFYYFYDEKKPVKCENVSYPEECLAPVLRRMYPVKCNYVFHPKLILARFVSKNDSPKTFWRVLVSSHNLTLSEAYEVGILLKSRESQNKNHNLDTFLSYLGGQANIDQAFKDYVNELNNLEFINYTSKPQGDIDRFNIELAVSGIPNIAPPRLFSDLHDSLNNHKDQWLVVSPYYETGEQYQENNHIFGPYTENKVEKKSHAKMFIHYSRRCEKPFVDQLILGSANCSESGLKKNIECLVKITLTEQCTNDNINNTALHIKNLDLSTGKEYFIFDDTRFERISDFQELDYNGINGLKKVIDNYEFEIEWSYTKDKKHDAYVKIAPKCDAKDKLNDNEIKNLKLLPYSMSEYKSGTAKTEGKWELFREEKIKFHGSKKTKETQILRLRYYGSSIHEVLWYRVANLTKSEEVLKTMLDSFFTTAYSSKVKTDTDGLYWGEFWDKYKKFCEFYKNDFSILNQLDQMYRRVWAARCTQDEWGTAPKQLPAAFDNYQGLMPYQKAAVEQIMESFDDGKQIFLVADEAGLGKTYIAQGVMKRMFEEWKKAKASQNNKVSNTFNIVYCGSNLFLLDKTAEKLTEKPGGSIDEDFNIIEGVNRQSMIRGAFTGDKKITPVNANMINLFMVSGNLIGSSADSLSPEGNDLEREFLGIYDDNKDKRKEKIKEGRQREREWLKNNKIVNLIIMDEFHRYDAKDIKENLIIPETKVLLLSATPYNWYGSNELEEGDFIENENREEESKISTFDDVLSLLNCDSMAIESYNGYKNSYKGFKASTTSPAEVEKHARIASDELKKYIWRNERIYAVDNKRLEIPGREALSGPEWQEAISGQLEAENSDTAKRYKTLFPGVYSFAIKKLVSKEGKKEYYDDLKQKKKSPDQICQDDNNFLFDSTNRLKADLLRKNLRTEIIRRLQVEPMKKMLWLTPSRTMYQPGEPFTQDTTKLLVFSAYIMVPRGIASIFSSYVSGNVVENDIVNNSIKQIKELDKTIIDKGLLSKICNIYNPSYTEATMKLNWEDFKNTFIHDKGGLLQELLQEILNFIDCHIELDTLAMYVLAAPFPCLYRICKDPTEATEGAEYFYEYFKQTGINQVLSEALKEMPGNNEVEKLLYYCGSGCLQDMLFEYYALTKNDFKKKLKDALTYEGSKVHVLNGTTYKQAISEFILSDEETEDWVVQCRFADRFTPDGTDTGVSGTGKIGRTHQSNVQEAFNSPFWPMILATTSMGQEGIDLDSYCRCIMHYSIPPSPMSFEQRDGRIDRRMSLASRQRMTQLWGNAVCMPECNCEDYWQQLYCQCVDSSGMSPLWSMREDIDGIRIERVIPFVPQSEEELAYRKLVNLKTRYRRSFGMPDEPEEMGESQIKLCLKLNDI